MNITKELKDDLNAVLKVVINKNDYEPNVVKVLNDYRKKARIDGFRPGMVPMGHIKKMYGKSILVEQINKLLSESVMKYIAEEKIHILGDPLPSSTEQKPIDWEGSEEFEFVFDLGIAPIFDITLSKKDTLKKFAIKPDSKLIETYSDNYTRRYGAFKICDAIVDGKEMVKGSLVELNDDKSVKENGLSIAESTLYCEFIKDEEIRTQFINLKCGDTLKLNVHKAFPNDVELASILHVKKEEVADIKCDFQLTITSISKFDKADINQELFDKVYGEGIVTSEADFKLRIEDEIKANLSRESEYKFRMDTKEFILNKVNFNLPVEFLKRWIFTSNEGKFTMEQIELEFDKFLKDLKWQLIKNKIVKENNLEVTEEEVLELAKLQTRMQFEQYGLSNVPEEHITNYAEESLKREEDRRRIFEYKFEDKVLTFISEKTSVEVKEVTSEEFDKEMEVSNQ